VVLAAACRLALMERAAGLADDAVGSFHRCVSGESPLRHFYPIPIQLGLHVEAALMLLARARKAAGPRPVDYGHADKAVQKDIDRAFSLLSTAQMMMTTRVDLDAAVASSQLHASALDPLPRSLLLTLPLPEATQPKVHGDLPNPFLFSLSLSFVVIFMPTTRHSHSPLLVVQHRCWRRRRRAA
jgi:hypothetical protein